MKKVLFASSLILTLCACSGSDPAASSNVSSAGVNEQISLSVEQEKTFLRTCALCHGVSGTGAPAPHDMQAWAPRNVQGMEVLLDHTINGVGSMPPMGMCMECTQEDFAVFIQFMSGMECDE